MKMLVALIIYTFLHVLNVSSQPNLTQTTQVPNRLQQNHSRTQAPNPSQRNNLTQTSVQRPLKQKNLTQTPVQNQPQKNNLTQTQVANSSQLHSLREMYDAIAAAKPEAYLNAHNAFRQKMGVPPLVWDKKLEAYARNYASTRKNDCLLKHSNGPYGENISWEQYGESVPAQVVKKFTDEQVNYDLENSKCKCHPISSRCMCAHFTAVIWRTTERVGCAEAVCSGEKGKLVVCSYHPPGNAIGQNPLNPFV